MARAPRRSNPLALAVLVLLFEKPMHAYEMAQTMRVRGKEQSIKLRYGSLYTVIELLVREGLIAVRETERAGRRPERTVYTLTEPGEVEMRRWLSEMLEIPVKEYPQFEAGLSLMPALPPDVVAALLAERRENLKSHIDVLRGQLESAHKAGLDPLFTVECAYELTMLEAERSFVERTFAAIKSGKLGATFGWKQLQLQRRSGKPRKGVVGKSAAKPSKRRRPNS